MNKFFLRCLGAAMAMVLLLTACAPKEQENSDSNKKVAMGRYVETQLPMPEEAGYVAAFYKNKEGNLEIIYNKNAGMGVGPWYRAVSQDGGKTWQPKEIPWLTGLGEISLSILNYNPADGGYVMEYTVLPPEILKMTSEELTALYENGQMPQPQLVYVNEQGNISQPKDVELTSESGITASNILVAENGDVFTKHYFDIIQWDSTLTKQKFVYSTDYKRIGSYCIVGDKLYIAAEEEIIVYNTANGQQLENFVESSTTAGKENAFKETGGTTGMLMYYEPESESIYYCDSSGIYRKTLEGSAAEKLVDGRLTALNMPSYRYDTLVANKDGECTLLLKDENGCSLMRYAYDATVPTTPDIELKVFSLADNKTVRQAMSLFQRSHPDVQVNYQVALEDGSITRTDALRTLSTEILSGKGPDILILDGTPVDSYIEKGVLMDLSDIAQSQNLLSNIAKSYEKDGKVYALPARFAVPIMLIRGDMDITDFSSLVQEVAQWQAENPGKSGVNTGLKVPGYLLQAMYTTCAPAWFNEDNTLNTQAFVSFLEDAKKFTDLYADKGLGFDMDGGINFNRMVSAESDVAFSAVPWTGGATALCMGELTAYLDVSIIDAAIKRTEGGAMLPLAGQTKGVFIPKAIAGINVATSQEELSKEFVQLLISEKIQNHDFSDGFPVNTASFEKTSENPYAEHDDGMYISDTNEDGETYTLQVMWPEEEFLTQFKETVAGLDKAVTIDYNILEIISTEARAYFEGSKSAQDTAATVAQKVQLYLSE